MDPVPSSRGCAPAGALPDVAEALQTADRPAGKVTAIFSMAGAAGVPGSTAAVGEGTGDSAFARSVMVDPGAANIDHSPRAPAATTL
jgi:inosine-uridine nucleoside N-ribohydrolase